MNDIKDFNLSIFNFLNKTFGQSVFEDSLTIINAIGDPNLFFYHLVFIFIIAITLIYRQKDNKNTLNELLILGFSSMITLVISLAIGLTIVELLKNYTNIARPYCSLDKIYALQHVIQSSICNHSFPSGHIAFSTIVVTSFWPLLNRFFKIIAIIFVCLLAISRVVSGAHFPMDLLGSIVICLPITLCIRRKITKIIDTRKQHLQKVFQKILKFN